MNYIIHNKKLIESETDRDLLEEIIEQKLELLENVLRGYGKQPLLEVHVNKVNDAGRYRISVTLNMKSKELFIEDQGEEIPVLAAGLMEKLRRWGKKQLQIERKDFLYKRKTRRTEKMGEHLPELLEHEQKEDRKEFIELLQQNLPGVKNYIRRRLKMAEATTLLKRRKVTLHDLTDELFVRVYERFPERPITNNNFLPWVFRLADEVIEEHLHELQFEQENSIARIEQLVEQEYKTLEEKFYTDAEGEFIMYDELDDPSYGSDYYHLEDVLTEGSEDALLEQLDHLDMEEAHEIMSIVLAKLPALERSVFDLYMLEQKSVEDIAYIKDKKEDEVIEIIEKVKNRITQFLKEEFTSMGKPQTELNK